MQPWNSQKIAKIRYIGDMKISVTIMMLSILLALNLGCGTSAQVTASMPARDATPAQLIPKQVEGLSLRETREVVGMGIIGAELGARGMYLDEIGTGEFRIEIYRFPSQEDASKRIFGMKHDILLHEKLLEEDQVVVFSSGVFLFAIWGGSADFVEGIARATGFYQAF